MKHSSAIAKQAETTFISLSHWTEVEQGGDTTWRLSAEHATFEAASCLFIPKLPVLQCMFDGTWSTLAGAKNYTKEEYVKTIVVFH